MVHNKTISVTKPSSLQFCQCEHNIISIQKFLDKKENLGSGKDKTVTTSVWKIFTFFISSWIRVNNYFLYSFIFQTNRLPVQKKLLYSIIWPKEINFWFFWLFFVITTAVLFLVFFSNGCFFSHQNTLK